MFVHKAGGGGQFAALAEFGQKIAAQNADGCADQKTEERNHQAAQNGIAQAAFHARRRCVERENMRAQAAEAFIKTRCRKSRPSQKRPKAIVSHAMVRLKRLTKRRRR